MPSHTRVRRHEHVRGGRRRVRRPAAPSVLEDTVAAVNDYRRKLDWLRKAGLRRFGGDYSITGKGRRYIRDVVRRDDEARGMLSEHAERWESGAMTKAERGMPQVELVFVALRNELDPEPEASAELRARGFDPAAALREGGYDVTPPGE